MSHLSGLCFVSSKLPGCAGEGSWVDFMSPVFCYDHIENVPVVYTGDWESGVTYTQGRDNEFFGATDKLIEAWEQLKAEMLQRYPR